MVSAAGDFVYAKFSEINVIIFTIKCNDSVSFSFLSPCFFSSLIKANHCVFELSVPCVCLFHCVIATEFDYRI